jgi:hypothetical protein
MATTVQELDPSQQGDADYGKRPNPIVVDTAGQSSH